MVKLKLKIKRLNKDAPIPSYGHKGDAAFDLYAAEKTVVSPNERKSIPVGIQMEIPNGYAGLVWDKSGLSHNNGIKTLGGVIDSIFRGEVRVGVINLGKEPYTFEKNHKVAQMIIQKVEEVKIEEVEELSETERGEKGWGSTGK
ncbi:MAG: dUTP diphosphatase [Candidatus Paceibacterota bacterium]|jgi:dUTP pyrophosphatase